jgi:high-affinity iron transporter
MQQASWLGTTTLKVNMPDWLNTWFAIYPSAESLLAQLFAMILVVGSYFLAQYLSVWRPQRQVRR